MSTVTLAGYSVTKPTAATVAAGTATGLLTDTGVYGYKVTYVTAFGETDGSTAASLTVTSTGSVNLTAIPVSSNANVKQRKLYRTAAGGSSYLLLATITDNETTTYTDLLADASLGAAIPTINNAHSYQTISGNVKIAQPTIHGLTAAIVANPGGGQTNAVQLTSEYNVVGTVTTTSDSVKLPELNADLIGMRVCIANDGVNAVAVFPALGQNASSGVDTSVSVAAAGRAEFVARTATAWTKFR